MFEYFVFITLHFISILSRTSREMRKEHPSFLVKYRSACADEYGGQLFRRFSSSVSVTNLSEPVLVNNF